MKTKSLKDLGRPIRIDSLEDSLFVNLFVSLQTLKRQVDHICMAHGISGSQYNVLRNLQAYNGKATVKEIYNAMLSKDAGVTRLIDKLIKAGYVIRKRGTKDRRVVFVTLTKAGERFTDILTQEISEMLNIRLSHMDRNEIEQLIILLAKARQTSVH